jgi:hypothetical protein
MDAAIRDGVLASLDKRWANTDQDVFLLSLILNPYIRTRDYRGCIWMYPDKYPWMVDKFRWIWMISMDIHIIHKTLKWAICQNAIVICIIDL